MSKDDWNFKVTKKAPTKVAPECPNLKPQKNVTLTLDTDALPDRASRRTHRKNLDEPQKASLKLRLFAFISELILILVLGLGANYLPIKPVLSFMIVVFIFLLPIFFARTTYGKMTFRIVIEDIDGGRLGLSRLFFREIFLRPLCMATIILALPIYSKRRQTFYDFLLKSQVYKLN